MSESVSSILEPEDLTQNPNEVFIEDLNMLLHYSEMPLSRTTITQLKLATLGTIDDYFDSDDIEVLSPPEPESERENVSQHDDQNGLQPSIIDLTMNTSDDSDSDPEISDEMNEEITSHPTIIENTFPPKQRGKGPRTRGTRTKIAMFETRTLNQQQRKLWYKYKREHQTARLEHIGYTLVVSVITSCLTPEQLARIKEEKDEATKIAREQEIERYHVLSEHVQIRQLEDWRAGKRDVGTIEWEEEMKGWSVERRKRYDKRNCVNALDLKIACFKIVEERLEGKKWSLRRALVFHL